VQTVFEAGYGISISIYDPALGAYKTGCSVSSTAARRAVTVTFQAVITAQHAAAATSSAQSLNSVALASNIQTAATVVPGVANISSLVPSATDMIVYKPVVLAPQVPPSSSGSSSSSSGIMLVVGLLVVASVLLFGAGWFAIKFFKTRDSFTDFYEGHNKFREKAQGLREASENYDSDPLNIALPSKYSHFKEDGKSVLHKEVPEKLKEDPDTMVEAKADLEAQAGTEAKARTEAEAEADTGTEVKSHPETEAATEAEPVEEIPHPVWNFDALPKPDVPADVLVKKGGRVCC